MRIGIYGVYDVVSRTWVTPLNFEPNEESAKRNFLFRISQNSFLKAHAKDFELYFLGYFEDELGMLVSASRDFDRSSIFVLRGDSLVQSEQDSDNTEV
nr:unnamed protein product [uncultured bacterium]